MGRKVGIAKRNEARTQTLNESLACQKLDVDSSFLVLRSLTDKHSISTLLGSTWDTFVAQEKVRLAGQSATWPDAEAARLDRIHAKANRRTGAYN